MAIRPACRRSSALTEERTASGWVSLHTHTTGHCTNSRYRALGRLDSRNEKIKCTSPSAKRFSTESKGISRSTGSTSGLSWRSRSSAGLRNRSIPAPDHQP